MPGLIGAIAVALARGDEAAVYMANRVGQMAATFNRQLHTAEIKALEEKTGDADLSIRQSEIFPQIRDGNSVPTGDVAKHFGLEPGLALKDQGYPDGIPIEERRFPGLGS